MDPQLQDELITVRKVAHGVLEFLDTELKKPLTTAATKESLEVAVQCLETVYGISLQDKEYQLARPLTELVGYEYEPQAPAPAAPSTGTGNPLMTGALSAMSGPETGNPLWAMAGGANPMTALMNGTFPISINPGEKYEKPEEATEEDKKLSEEWKNKGNDAMKADNFAEAVEHYNKAVELDGNNPALFCNRAAAFIKTEDYENAMRDCEIAAQLDPSYARAYGRMGVVYSTQNLNVDAILCFKKALDLDPDHESYKTNFLALQRSMLQDLPAVMAQVQDSTNLQYTFQDMM